MKKIIYLSLLAVISIVLLMIVGTTFQEDAPTYETPVSNLSEPSTLDNEPSNDNATSARRVGLVDIADISSDIKDVTSHASSVQEGEGLSDEMITKYTSQQLNMMSEADSLSMILGTIPKGTPVKIFEDCDCKWICVVYNNHYGYVRSALLQNTRNSSPAVAVSPIRSGNSQPPSAHESHESTDETESAIPKGATAICRDGTYSFSRNRRGTCSWHGGVAKWLK